MNALGLFERLAAALAIGLLVGIERGWTEREAREGERAAGLRTLALAGLLGGVWAALAAGDGGAIALAVAFLVLSVVSPRSAIATSFASGAAGSGPAGVIIAADVARARPSMAEVAHSLPQVDVPGQGRAMTSMEKAVISSNWRTARSWSTGMSSRRSPRRQPTGTGCSDAASPAPADGYQTI